MITEWLNVHDNQEEIASLKGKIDPEIIKDQTPKFIGNLNSLADSVFSEFCELIKNQYS